MKPNDEQIQKEIKRLEEIKPRVRHFSMFGDDNHARIQAQIDTLKEGLTEDQIYDRWDGEDEQSPDLVSEALSARAWADTGETSDGELDLVSAWEPLTALVGK